MEVLIRGGRKDEDAEGDMWRAGGRDDDDGLPADLLRAEDDGRRPMTRGGESGESSSLVTLAFHLGLTGVDAGDGVCAASLAERRVVAGGEGLPTSERRVDDVATEDVSLGTRFLPLFVVRVLILPSMRLKGDMERDSDDATDDRRLLALSSGGVLSLLDIDVWREPSDELTSSVSADDEGVPAPYAESSFGTLRGACGSRCCATGEFLESSHRWADVVSISRRAMRSVRFCQRERRSACLRGPIDGQSACALDDLGRRARATHFRSASPLRVTRSRAPLSRIDRTLSTDGRYDSALASYDLRLFSKLDSGTSGTDAGSRHASMPPCGGCCSSLTWLTRSCGRAKSSEQAVSCGQHGGSAARRAAPGCGPWPSRATPSCRTPGPRPSGTDRASGPP